MTKIENLPQEISTAQRWLPVALIDDGRTLKKIPRIKEWTRAENLMPAEVAAKVTGLVGFVVAGGDIPPEFAFLDFDHCLDSDGQFTTPEAERVFNDITGNLESCFAEKSASGTGLHVFLRPTPGKFPIVTNNSAGVLWFDREKNSKLEIFYDGGGRFCLTTGDLYECEKGAGIPSGAAVDEIFSSILRRIEQQNETQISRRLEGSNDGQANSAGVESTEPEYDKYRGIEMLRAILRGVRKEMKANPTKERKTVFGYSDWIKVQTVCKNVGVPYEIVDKFNQSPLNGGNYDAEQNLKRWEGLGRGAYASMGIGVLAKIAQRFGYSERQTRIDYRLAQSAESQNGTRVPISTDAPKPQKTIEENPTLKKFVDSQGGSWRGLSYGTLNCVGCRFEQNYNLGDGQGQAACILLPNVSPSSKEFTVYQTDSDSPPVLPVTRRLRRLSKINFATANFIVDSDLDALSIVQAMREYDATLRREKIICGVWSVPSPADWRLVLAELERRFKTDVKPRFIVLFANSTTIEDFGRALTEGLKARGFEAVQNSLTGYTAGRYTRQRLRGGGNFGEIEKFEVPVVTPNDLLKESEGKLFKRLIELVFAFGQK